MTTMDSQTLSILGAVELIAVNQVRSHEFLISNILQDPLGVQGDLIWQLGPMQIWAGPLADGIK